jgi:alanine racemase
MSNAEGRIAAHRRPNRLVIDSLSVVRRVSALRQKVGAGVRVFAALKADGYGFGTLPMARAALDGGADALSLIDRAEAIKLREAGVTAPILLYAGAPIDAEAVAVAERHALTLTVLSLTEVMTMTRLARAPIDLAIKVEVGAERIGVLPTELVAMAGAIAAAPNLRFAIVNTHPMFRDDAPDSVVIEQYRRFVAAVEQLKQAGLPMPIRLFASSKTLGRCPEMVLDAVDPGQFLYAEATERPIIRSLTSVLTQVRAVTRDVAPEHVPFDVNSVQNIGVIPFGKVDGGGRCHAPEVLVRGRRAPILGGPSLEYMRIDLSAHPDAEAGDAVVLIGRQGDAAITLSEVCAAQNATPSDLAMTIGPAVLRSWTMTENVSGGEVRLEPNVTGRPAGVCIEGT